MKHGTEPTVSQFRLVKRKESLIAKRAIEEAKLEGNRFYCVWQDEDGTTEFLTIRGAYILVRLWGNCWIDVGLESESNHAWTFKATLYDLESRVAIGRLHQQLKPAEDLLGTAERDALFGTGQSKAIKKAVEATLPQWLIHKCIDAAKTVGVPISNVLPTIDLSVVRAISRQ